MNWYKKAKSIISPKDIRDIKRLVQKIINGRKDWTPKELQLQDNFPDLLEKMLQDEYEII